MYTCTCVFGTCTYTNLALPAHVYLPGIVHACMYGHTRRIAIARWPYIHTSTQKCTVYSLCTASSISLFSRGSGALLGREMDFRIYPGRVKLIAGNSCVRACVRTCVLLSTFS